MEIWKRAKDNLRTRLPNFKAPHIVPLRRFVVEEDSMTPAYNEGDRLLISPILLLFSPPTEGDVVVIQHPKGPRKRLLKRVIGIPGDRVEGIELGPGEYFVLGDNKGKSEDSRHFGVVKRSQILGKVWFRY